jgi:hypothetical protein
VSTTQGWNGSNIQGIPPKQESEHIHLAALYRKDTVVPLAKGRNQRSTSDDPDKVDQELENAGRKPHFPTRLL